jgi:glycosyltransferase involved in cell wall biosynthesis
MASDARSLVLFDPSGTAHSFNAIEGLVRAAAARRIPLTVLSPKRPEAIASGPGGATRTDLRWERCEVAPVLTDRASRHAHRRALVDAIHETATPGTVFCDMGLGRTLASRGPGIGASPATVFVTHQTNAIDPRIDTFKRRRYIARNVRVLSSLGRQGAQFIVHTPGTRDRMSDFVPGAQLHLHGWPVVSADDPCLGPDWKPQPDGTVLLFAGSARIEKGLLTLLDAVRTGPSFDRLIVPGRIPGNVRARLGDLDPRVELWDRWLDPDEYRELFGAASLVVLPYRDRYEAHGTYSSVLGEALAAGRPVLVSEPLRPLLPDGYGGAVSVEPDSVTSLVQGLDQALDDLPGLERAAMADGRAYIARHHTYEQYLTGILEAPPAT